MARDFKIELDNVEMINGSDDLLKDTKVTKVTITGENKLNSLNSTFENCTELTSIEGEINLDGISDMTEMALNTTVDEIKVTNPTEENIQANDSLNQIGNVKIGGTKYSKGGVQDVVGSLEWNAENFTYEDTILDNVYTNSSSIEDNKNITVSDTLEQKATSIEITGQTYENLVNGKATENLLDKMSMQQTEGKPTQFTPHMEQPICLEYIEGETYQNLIEGKGEYKLTDTFSTTWTESNNSIENAPSMIEIPEIFGNTVQGVGNIITAKNIVESINSAIFEDSSVNVSATLLDNNQLKMSREGLHDLKLSSVSSWVQLKSNTTYTVRCYYPNYKVFATPVIYLSNMTCIKFSNYDEYKTFTTDSTGKVLFFPNNYSTSPVEVFLAEGEPSSYKLQNKYEFDKYYPLNYIQSVGDLYVDESGEPILDEEGNEQYKLEMFSHGYVTDEATSRSIIQNLSLNSAYKNVTVYAGTAVKAYFQCIAKIDTTKAETGYFCTFTQGGANSIKYYSTDRSLKLLFDSNEYFLGYVDYDEPFSITIKQINADNSLLVYFNGNERVSIDGIMFGHGNFVAFNSKHHTGTGNGCNAINIIYAQCSKNLGGYVGVDEDDWTNINKWNKTTILMPQPLMKLKKVNNNYSDLSDKLYWDSSANKYYIENNIYKLVIKRVNDSSYNGTFFGDIQLDNIEGIDISFLYQQRTVIPFIQKMTYTGWGNRPTNSDFGVGVYSSGAIRIYGKEGISITPDEMNKFIGDGLDFFVERRTPQIIETKILEKPSLETYSPKTYITTNTEIQPSQMTVTNKKVDYIPLGLQPNKDYTLQLDSTGKNDKPITVNLGGTETTIQPINDTSKHHKVVVRTPNTLTTDKLDLSGEGVVVNDVMLFEGGSNEIKQEVGYVDGIESIGEYYLDYHLNLDEFSSSSHSSYYKLQDRNINVLQVDNRAGANSVLLGIKNGDYTIDVTDNTLVQIFTASGTWVTQLSNGENINITEPIRVKLTSTNNTYPFTTHFNLKKDNSAYEECYKIDILTTNGVKNLVNTNPNNWVVKDSDSVIIKSSIKVNEGKTYTVFNSTGQWVAVYESDRNGNQYNLIGQDNTGNWSFVATSEYIKVSLWNISYISDKLSQPHNMNVRIFEGYNDCGYNGYEERKLSTQSILLPQPLNKIGDIKDKFYWDDNKGHYCIEQNIDENLEALDTPNIIDLPHLNKKYSVDTYMPTTYLECTNSPMQPSRILLESDTVRYKSTIEPNTLYTIQFNCLKETIAISTLNLGGTIIEVVPTIGLNHFTITTSNTLTSNELSIIDSDSRFIDVIVNEGEMNQYPNYFDGVQSVGELQDDGTYKIDILTNEGFNISIISNSPLAKGDKLYWNKSNKRYEIDRGGSVEVPTVSGDVIDLPRLYQREDTTISISTDNIEPSKIDISYKDIH